MEKLGEKVKSKVEVIAMESFYKDLDAKDIQSAESGEYNFDHPGKLKYISPCLIIIFIYSLYGNISEAFDLTLLEETFEQIKNRALVSVPVYDKITYKRYLILFDNTFAF